MKRVLYILLSGALLLSSCTIKESRDGCPCYLKVSSAVHYPGYLGALVCSSREDIVDRLSRRSLNYENEFTVMKGKVLVAAWSGESGAVVSHRYMLEDNKCVDSLYARSTELECLEDVASIFLSPIKQFSTVSVSIIHKDGELCPYSYRVSDNAGRFNLETCTSEAHAHSFSGKFDGQSWTTHFRLLRQNDDQCMMILKNTVEEEDERTVSLSQLFRLAGVDWTKLILDDITITINLDAASFNVKVGNWFEGTFYDYDM